MCDFSCVLQQTVCIYRVCLLQLLCSCSVRHACTRLCQVILLYHVGIWEAEYCVQQCFCRLVRSPGVLCVSERGYAPHKHKCVVATFEEPRGPMVCPGRVAVDAAQVSCINQQTNLVLQSARVGQVSNPTYIAARVSCARVKCMESPMCSSAQAMA